MPYSMVAAEWNELAMRLEKERDEARALVRELRDAFDRMDSNRGRCSTVDPHDLRCPKARGIKGACACGADEWEALIAKIAALPWAREA